MRPEWTGDIAPSAGETPQMPLRKSERTGNRDSTRPHDAIGSVRSSQVYGRAYEWIAPWHTSAGTPAWLCRKSGSVATSADGGNGRERGHGARRCCRCCRCCRSARSTRRQSVRGLRLRDRHDGGLGATRRRLGECEHGVSAQWYPFGTDHRTERGLAGHGVRPARHHRSRSLSIKCPCGSALHLVAPRVKSFSRDSFKVVAQPSTLG